MPWSHNNGYNSSGWTDEWDGYNRDDWGTAYGGSKHGRSSMEGWGGGYHEGPYGYADQSDRNSGSYSTSKPRVAVEKSITFEEEQIKQILADYAAEHYQMYGAEAKNVVADYRQASGYHQLDTSPGYCRFTVKVKS